MSRRNGYIIYRGPSMLDGKPIVVIATGFANDSTNGKTGNLIQTWILREDMKPIEAVNNGKDSSICGACPHRGEIVPADDGEHETKNIGRSCYIKVWQAPSAVYGAYKRGSYPEMTAADLGWLFVGKAVRFGAYGDPAAIPLHIVDTIGSVAEFTTGYTHQWLHADTGYNKWLMASCDNAGDRFMARAFGYRTFRVRAVSENLGKKEIICPASKEAGYKTTCSDCRACGGRSTKAKVDIAIFAHGEPGKVNNYYERINEFNIKKVA